MMPVVQWANTALGGPGSLFRIDTLDGWWGTGNAAFEDVPATGRHGSDPTAGRQAARFVTIGGHFWADTAQERAALRAELARAFAPAPSWDDTTRPLTITAYGQTLTAQAQLATQVTPEDFRLGPVQRWAVQFRCPDPRLFGPDVTASAPLVRDVAGRKMPFRMPAGMPVKPIGGAVFVDNPGNDPEGSPVSIALAGSQTGPIGVVIAGTGKRVIYDFALDADDVLTVSSLDGADLNGAYRASRAAGSNTTAELALPPGPNLIQALGAAGPNGQPAITVTVTPSYWT